MCFGEADPGGIGLGTSLCPALRAPAAALNAPGIQSNRRVRSHGIRGANRSRPAGQARNFIAAYALDGEFLPKVRGEEAIISLDIYDAHNLYRLLSRIVSLNKYRERIGTFAKATDSMPLKDMYSQLQESQLIYRQLEGSLGRSCFRRTGRWCAIVVYEALVVL